MGKVTLSRKELYEKVWIEPLIQIAGKYKISNTELRKVCDNMQIPVPPVGYWSKLSFGKTVERTPLPEPYSGMTELSLWEKNDKNGEEYKTVKEKSEWDLGVKDIKPKFKLKVPAKLPTVMHPLIFKFKRYYESGKISREDVLNINVTSDHLDRALRIMNTFIQALFKRELDIYVIYGKTYVKVKNTNFEISFREVKTKPGILCLRVGNGLNKEFADNRIPLEEKLPQIISFLEQKGNFYYESHLENIRIKEEKEEREKMALELQRRKSEELKAFKSMFIAADRFQKASYVRDYINSLENSLKQRGKLSSEMQEWIRWARKKVDWYDPFIESEDELFADVDRDTLEIKA